MPDENDKEVARLTVILLCALPNWDRGTLFRKSGVYPSQLSEYQTGKVVPRRRNIGRIASAVKVQPHLLAHMESFLKELVTAWKSGSGAPASSTLAGDDGWEAEIVEQETAQARAELALLRRLK